MKGRVRVRGKNVFELASVSRLVLGLRTRPLRQVVSVQQCTLAPSVREAIGSLAAALLVHPCTLWHLSLSLSLSRERSLRRSCYASRCERSCFALLWFVLLCFASTCSAFGCVLCLGFCGAQLVPGVPAFSFGPKFGSIRCSFLPPSDWIHVPIESIEQCRLLRQCIR